MTARPPFPFADFLPAAARLLEEPAARTLLQGLKRSSIETYLDERPIETAWTAGGSTGEALLLLHGFDSSVLEFRRLLPLLMTGARVWALDLLGFGFTDRPPGIAYTPAAIKHHLYRFWRSCIGEPVTLVGSSMGGAVAIDFAATYPEAVHRLVLVNSMGFTGAPAFVQWLPDALGGLAVEYWRQRKLQALALSVRAASSATDDIRSCALHLEMPGWREALVRFNRSGGYSTLALPFAAIKAETLILWGRGDEVLGDLDAQKFAETIRSSRLLWIDRGGHTPHLSQPALTARHILDACS